MWSRERSLVVLIVFTILSSSVIMALPAPVSAGAVISTPSDTIIDVLQGQVFLVRTTLQFNQPQPGYFAFVIYWYTNESSDNYTLENAPSAYWTSIGSPNPDSIGDPVENVMFDNTALTGETAGWQVSAIIDSGTKNYYNGTFNIDFWLRAASWGAPHQVGLENNLSYGVGIAITEGTPVITAEDNIAVNVLPVIRSAYVSILPPESSAFPGENVTFTVTVKNTGNVPDNYSLENSDNSGWAKNVSPTSLSIPVGENRTATLSVTVPGGAPNGAKDNITLRATSMENENVYAENNCIAEAVTIIRGVSVSILPSSKIGDNGATLTYTVTVTNTGNVSDNYSLTVSDNASPSWSSTVSPTSIVVAPSSSDNTTTLSVTIPDNDIPGTIDNITVTATSQADNAINSSASCTALVNITRSVSASISPSIQSGENGATLNYTVTINNTGNVSDNYSLTPTDNASPSWSPSVLPTSLVIAAFSSDNATLSVTIPSGAIDGDEDNVTVTANGTGDSASANTLALCTIVVVQGVSVSISPSSQGGANGATLNYTVTVTNTGNASDNYSLVVTDNENWSPSVLPTSRVVAPFSSDNTITLSVTIPVHAIGGTVDNIRVTATSKIDNTVSATASCTGQATIARSVSVSISPSSKSGADNTTLTYTVTVSNTGNVSDNYVLTDNDNAGWSPSVSPTSKVVAAFSSDNTITLSVTIPSNAVGGTIDNIRVTATSQADNTVSATASCTAQSTTASRSVRVSISPSTQSGANGATLTYTVTVTNTGGVSDNYTLTSTDNASPSWSRSLSSTSLTIPAGENRTSTLSVTVPSSAIGGTIDNIRVTATSRTDNTVSTSSSCTGQATIARSVRVSISPSSKSGANGTTLTYTVTVSNTGNVSDNYILTDNDNAGWSPSVSPTSRVVAAFSSDNTIKLSVTVPSNAIKGTVDNIRVTATSRADNTVSNSASCVTTSTGQKPTGGISLWVYLVIILVIIVVIIALILAALKK